MRQAGLDGILVNHSARLNVNQTNPALDFSGSSYRCVFVVSVFPCDLLVQARALNRAIEMDRADALPVALLACCEAQLAQYYGMAEPPAAQRDRAMQLAARAGMLDDGDPLVTLARGATAALALQSQEADALVTRALAMDPTCSWAWERHGLTRLSSGGDPDCAIADFAQAVKLRGPALSRANCFSGIAVAHAAAGRLADAVLRQRKALAENRAGTWTTSWIPLRAKDGGPAETGVRGRAHAPRAAGILGIRDHGHLSSGGPGLARCADRIRDAT